MILNQLRAGNIRCHRRPIKTGREEIVGLLAAVEWPLQQIEDGWNDLKRSLN